MRIVVWLSLMLLAPVQTPTPAPSATSSKVWVGRYAEFEEFIRSAKIERAKDVTLGVTHPVHAYFAPGGLAEGVALKNLPPGRIKGYWESYKSEIAAYKIDRMLQLDMVPPTVERRHDGAVVSAQLWVTNTRMIKEIAQPTPPDTFSWNRQIHRQKVFDDLIGNIDDNAGNILIDPLWNLVLIDHSRCFTDPPKMPFPLEQIPQIDRELFGQLKALKKEDVDREVGELLERGEATSMMKRRDTIVAYFEKLAASKGEAAVFVP